MIQLIIILDVKSMATIFKSFICCGIYSYKLAEPAITGALSIPAALNRRFKSSLHFIFNTSKLPLKTRLQNSLTGLFTEYENMKAYSYDSKWQFFRDFKITKLAPPSAYNIAKLNLCHLSGIITASIALNLLFPYFGIIDMIIMIVINKLIIKPLDFSYFTTFLTSIGQQTGLFIIFNLSLYLDISILIAKLNLLIVILISLNLLIFFLISKLYILPSIESKNAQKQ